MGPSAKLEPLYSHNNRGIQTQDPNHVKNLATGQTVVPLKTIEGVPLHDRELDKDFSKGLDLIDLSLKNKKFWYKKRVSGGTTRKPIMQNIDVLGLNSQAAVSLKQHLEITRKILQHPNFNGDERSTMLTILEKAITNYSSDLRAELKNPKI